MRRTVLITLDANVENPAERTFTQNPVALVLADRGEFVAAVLTIARAYHWVGRPDACRLRDMMTRSPSTSACCSPAAGKTSFYMQHMGEEAVSVRLP